MLRQKYITFYEIKTGEEKYYVSKNYFILLFVCEMKKIISISMLYINPSYSLALLSNMPKHAKTDEQKKKREEKRRESEKIVEEMYKFLYNVRRIR